MFAKSPSKGKCSCRGATSHTRVYATYFCRACGQEHHPVTLTFAGRHRSHFIARNIDDVAREAAGEIEGVKAEQGFITPVTGDDMAAFQGAIDDYPDEWLEETRRGEPRIKSTYRDSQADQVYGAARRHRRDERTNRLVSAREVQILRGLRRDPRPVGPRHQPPRRV